LRPNRDLIAIVLTQGTNFFFNGARNRFWREVYAEMAARPRIPRL
jgi:hypothetical protein